MENNKIFIWIWRLNGVLILLVVGLLAGFLIYELTNNILRPKPEENLIVNVAEDPKGEEKWELGNPTYIAGNDYLLLPLVSENKEVKTKKGVALASVSYEAYRNDPTKNILFLNTKNNVSFWLFNDTDRLIKSTEQFPYSYRSDGNSIKTKAIFYEVVSSDTNGDTLLTFEDKLSLTMSSPDGADYTTVLSEYDKIISKSLVGDNSILILYQINGAGMSQLVQISPFKLIDSKELPRIEK
ncbi:MAG: hypothetical protein ACRBCI_14285 [Cellvibrionaceae bacterium]